MFKFPFSLIISLLHFEVYNNCSQVGHINKKNTDKLELNTCLDSYVDHSICLAVKVFNGMSIIKDINKNPQKKKKKKRSDQAYEGQIKYIH